MKNRKQLIDSFVRRPTTYTIAVRKNAMLPKEIKDKKEISFTIKPPTLYVLSLAASVMASVPEKLLSGETMDLNEAMEYQEHMVKMLCILFYEEADYPEWYPKFILYNLSSIELLQIMQETAVKCSPGFFLNFFQVAAQSNPMMMMMVRTKGSTPLDL